MEYNFLKLIARAQKLGLAVVIETRNIPDMFDIKVSGLSQSNGSWGYDRISVLTHGMGAGNKHSYEELDFFMNAFEEKSMRTSIEGKLTDEELVFIGWKKVKTST